MVDINKGSCLAWLTLSNSNLAKWWNWRALIKTPLYINNPEGVKFLSFWCVISWAHFLTFSTTWEAQFLIPKLISIVYWFFFFTKSILYLQMPRRSALLPEHQQDHPWTSAGIILTLHTISQHKQFWVVGTFCLSTVNCLTRLLKEMSPGPISFCKQWS